MPEPTDPHLQRHEKRRPTGRAGLFAMVLVAVLVIVAWPDENPKRTPATDQRVAELREASATRMAAALDEFEQISSFDSASAQSTDELCNEGADDWKRKDPYKEQCVLGTTRYFGFNGDFEETVLDLHTALRQEGWDDPYGGTNHISRFLGYYRPGSERGGRTFDVSMMPGLNNAYEIDGLRVQIEFAERSSPLESDPFNNVAALSAIAPYYRSSDIVDYQVPIRELADTNTYFLAVRLSESYYR